MISEKDGVKTITGKSNRLVYASKAVYENELIALIDGTEKSKTWTIHSVEEFNDKSEAIAYIEERGWEVPDSVDLESIQNIIP
jgi:hypothetical protein